MSRRGSLAAAILALALLAPPAFAQAAPSWQAVPMPVPPGGLFRTPVGVPGDLKFWAPNRGLMTVGGNNSVAEGIYYWDGVEWRQLATVCGGGNDARIAWAGPTEFWVIARPSLPRAQETGVALCRFKDGQVVASYSTPRSGEPDPFHRMLAATCLGPNDCWFGGVGGRDGPGQRIGAFHLHWNGSTLRSVYGPQGRAVSDLLAHGGELFESTFVGREPGDRAAPDLRDPEDAPRLIHRVSGGDVFTNDHLVPTGEFSDGRTEIRALDSDGQTAWAVGGGAVSGPALIDTFAERPPFAARLAGGAWSELTLSGPDLTTTTVFGDVAAVPGTQMAWAAVREEGAVSAEEGEARQPVVFSLGPTGETERFALEDESSPEKGAAWRVACPAANDCWLATARGYLYRWTDHAAPPAYARDTEPAFQGLITVRPNEAAEQPIPDDPPEDTSLLNAPPVELVPDGTQEELPPCTRLPSLVAGVKAKARGRTRLVVSFRLRRAARVGLVARRRGKVVARAKLRRLRPGRRSLTLRVSAKRWPTRLGFVVRGDRRPRRRCQGGGGGDSNTVTVPTSAAAHG